MAEKRRKHKWSYRTRLIVSVLAVTMVPLLISSVLMLQGFRVNTKSRETQDAADTVEKISSTYRSLCADMRTAAGLLVTDSTVCSAMNGDRVTDAQLYMVLFSALKDIGTYTEADLYYQDGSLAYSTGDRGSKADLPVDWGILYAAGESGTPVFRFGAPDGSGTDSAVRLAAAIRNNNKVTGYAVLTVKTGFLEGLLRDRLNSGDDFILMSPHWHPVLSNRTGLAEEIAPRLRTQLLEKGNIEENDGIYTYHVWQDGDTGCAFVLRRAMIVSDETTRHLQRIASLCAVAGVAVAVWLSLLLGNSALKPVKVLENAFDCVGRNDLSVRIENPEDDEFGRLSKGFNGMVKALEQNQQELVENERALNEAQLRMLQAQLNPHFLCNTLDTMKWISKINRVPQVAEMSTDLADILRFCIAPEEFVSLRRELQVLRRYIEIQDIRLSSKFVFEDRIPEGLLDYTVPKMLLQPLVENAILHGIDALENGKIVLSAEINGAGMLCIRVADNGPGFPEEMTGPYHGTPATDGRHHLGMYNIDTILKKHYGQGSGLVLQNSPEGGAQVTAILPAEKEKDE